MQHLDVSSARRHRKMGKYPMAIASRPCVSRLEIFSPLLDAVGPGASKQSPKSPTMRCIGE